MSNQEVAEGHRHCREIEEGEGGLLILALGCTLTRDNQRLSTSSEAVVQEAVLNWRIAKRQGIHKYVAIVMVGSGYKQKENMDHWESELMVKRAIELGVDPDAVFEEPYSFDTPLNAEYTAPVVQKRTWSLILLVADALHMKRARFTFKLIWRILLRRVVTFQASPAQKVVYGDSSKWFLRSCFSWWLWNKLAGLHTVNFARKLSSQLRQ